MLPLFLKLVGQTTYGSLQTVYPWVEISSLRKVCEWYLNTLLLIAQWILPFMFTVSAFMKLRKTRSMLQHWRDYRYPLWFMYVIAVLEFAGAAAMISSLWLPGLETYATALFAVLMVGAIHAHVFRAKHEPVMASNAVFLLALSILILAG